MTMRTASWSRALSLRERGVPPPARAARPRKRELAERRFARWAAQAPFGDERLFRQRLACDGLMAEDLLRLLGESPRQVAARVPGALAWADGTVRAYASAPVSPVAREQAEFALVCIAQPLLDRAVARVRDGMPPRFDAPRLSSALAGTLRARLFPILARTLAVELHAARQDGLLRGDSPAERFWSFVDLVRAPGGGLAILAAYPVLARQVALHLEQGADAALEFLGRLDADWPLLEATFGPLGRLTDVVAGLSDPHAGGRGVLIAHFETGQSVVYKPKSLAVDGHFQDLLRWLNEHGQEPTLRTLSLLDRGEYGWVELVQPRACDSRAAVERFYARQGSLLALLYVLAATDFHYENIVAQGEHPLLIDLEALLHPGLRTLDPTDALQQALAHLDDSVLSVGLLPQLMRLNPGGAGLDVSGLGATTGQLSPRGVPRWEGGASDEARITYQRVPLSPGVHRPTLDGQPVDVLDYASQLLDGFGATYRLLARHRASLLDADGPVARFAQDEVRLLLRPTVIYARLLSESWHPDLLRDALERDRFFDRLWVAVPFQPRLASAIHFEQDDLWHGDIPRFTTRPEARAVWTTHGERLAEYVEEAGLDVARRRIAGLGEADLARQTWFARAALGGLPNAAVHAAPNAAVDAAPDADRRVAPDAAVGLEPNAGSVAGGPWRVPGARTREATSDELVAAAQAIGERLDELAFRGRHDAAWVGIASSNGVSVAPPGADLYEGLPGVALFLAYLGQVTGEPRFGALARAALANLRRQLDAGVSVPTTIGAMSGWGGIIYALAHLGRLWQDRALFEEAHRACGRVEALLEQDEHLDVASGSAGASLALLGLYAGCPTDDVLALAIRCGEHLLSRGRRMAVGIGWPAAGTSETALTGFAHGAAGIARALFALADAAGDDRFRVAASAGLEYERSLFSEAARNWPDLRGGRTGFMVAWCHGAPGIGLGRLASLGQSGDPVVRGEIAAALETTLALGAGTNEALCHGDLGNLDLLVMAGEQLAEPRWTREARCWAGGLLARAAANGWRCATPFGLESPGLMTGLAGIGYGLLRVACPERVPSLLALEPPRPSARRRA